MSRLSFAHSKINIEILEVNSDTYELNCGLTKEEAGVSLHAWMVIQAKLMLISLALKMKQLMYLKCTLIENQTRLKIKSFK